MTEKFPVDNLDPFIVQMMNDWDVPGCAVGIVNEGQIVFARGYGVRNVASNESVDEHSIFGLGSSSKALTALLIAVLIDEGKMAWDGRVREYLPDFLLSDGPTTDLITIRDLLTHQSGLPSVSGFFRYEVPIEADEVVYRLRHIKLAYPFRTRFCYSDFGYVVAGSCAEAATGLKWGELIKEKLFLPLDMKASHTSIQQLQNETNLAFPHTQVNGKVESVNYRKKDNTTGAASVNSNLSDLMRWLQLIQSGGVYGDQRVVSTANVNEMCRVQVLIRGDVPKGLGSDTENSQTWSGLGWNIEQFHGKKLVYRAGAIPGMGSYITLLPESSVGIVVLANSDAKGGNFQRIISNHIAEMYLRVCPTDWHKDRLAAYTEKKKKEESVNTQRQVGTRCSVPLEKFAGLYREAMLGECKISLEGGQLKLSYSDIVADLQHWQDDTFLCLWKDAYLSQFKLFAKFSVNLFKSVRSLNISGQGTFTRVDK